MCCFICSYSVRMSYPATLPVPLVGWFSPVSMCIAVVFPAPLAPKKPNISPFFTVNDISSTARKLPKAFTKCSTSITFSVCFAVSQQCLCSMRGGLKTASNCVSTSVGVPIPFIIPSERNATRSHLCTSSRYGVDAMIVILRSFICARMSQNSLLLTGSTPVVGSSRNSICGL